MPFAFHAPNDLDALGGAAARYAKNVAALRLLRAIQAERRAPETLTYQEQLTLAQYTAFADSEVLNRAFVDAAKTGQETTERFTPNSEIATLLDAEAQASIRRTALTAFYTPLPIVAAVWAALLRLGLESIPVPRILEPAAGTGNFLSMMPADLRRRSEITAVELDPTTAQIVALLHPDIRLFGGTGFERVALPHDYFDVVISNVPFSEIGVADPSIEPYLTRTLHDYFFAKALTLVRPNGIIAFLTSYGTMDKADSRVRSWIARRARLLTAIRLPNGVFHANAGSESGTDLLILQRIGAGEDTDVAPWCSSDWTTLPLTDGRIHLTTGSRYGRVATHNGAVRVSQHFATQPDDIIGAMYAVQQSGATWLYVAPPQDTPIAAALSQRLAALPTNVLAPAVPHTPPVRSPTPVYDETITTDPCLTGADTERVQAMLEIYTTAKQVIQLEVVAAPVEEVALARQHLNTRYDAFVRMYGVLHARRNRRVLKDMPELAFLLALETDVRDRKTGMIAHKAPIFTRATVRPARAIADRLSAQDALLVCLDALGRVDIDHIAERAELPRAAVLDALRGVVYRVPDPHAEHYMTADAYLSGNIREKLRAAQALAAIDPSFHGHVTALHAALPAPLTPSEITANLGASWIPAEDVGDFIHVLLPSFDRRRVVYHVPLAKWEINTDSATRTSVAATATWGTLRMDAISIIEESLNGRIAMVYDIWEENGAEKRRANDAETLAAQDKQTQIKERFSAWVWEDAVRAERLAAIYNERYNSVKLRQYDGSHLSLPGMNTSILRDGDLACWQKDAVWQALQNQTSLIGHIVGAGKTFELLAIAHEAKRMGLASKPLVIVPNHLVEQWAQEAYRLYPGLRVLAMSPEDFAQERRGTYLSMIATGTWDLIIVAHTSFKFLPVAAETLRSFLNKRVRALRQFLEELQNEDGKRRTLKEIEKRIAKLELKLAQTELAIGRDDTRTITWDELGVDMLLVDEAHEFKNLEIETRMDRVAGVPRSGSQRAFDLWLKTWDLVRRGGKVVFATGTPVANTLAEVFVMMRYLQNDLLERLGLDHFDAWVATFAQTQMAFELRPDGSGYRMHTRLNRFVNVPELATLWRQCLNVRTAEQLNLPRPTLASGKPIPVVVPPSSRLKAFVARLVERVERIKNRDVEPWQDNMLRITGEGRLAALDVRLVMGGPEEPDCKINALVDRVTRIYQESDAQNGTQLVFCDLSTPKGSYDAAPRTEESASATDDLSAHEQVQRGLVYHEIRQKLVARGIPRAEIAFIHEHATKTRREQLFADVRAGHMRVLIGSTAKMGTGMNVQERLIALHHLDAPWRPCDIEQREGRILRQGNRWPEVAIYQYVTEGSFDSYIWQLLENKARFISQVMAGEVTQRTVDDVAEVVLTAAEIKALASGNPKVVQKVQLDAELGRLERVRSVWLHGRLAAQRELEQNVGSLAELAHDIATRQHAISLRDAQRGTFALTVYRPDSGPAIVTDRESAGKAVRTSMRAWSARELATSWDDHTTIVRAIGVYQGLGLELRIHWLRREPGEPELFIVHDHNGQRRTLAAVNAETDTGVIASLDYHIRTLEEQVAARQRRQQQIEAHQAELAASIARPWDGTQTYHRVRRELQRLNAELSGTEVSAALDDADTEMDSLLAAARALTAAPAPSHDPAVPANGGHGLMQVAPKEQAITALPIEAIVVDPAPLRMGAPPAPSQPIAPAPDQASPTQSTPTAIVTFGDHSWMVARRPRRKTTAAPVSDAQLRLFE